ncbi:MAG: N-carbamoylputrescine amidase [Pseudanabaenaceae cyanobacterium]
MVTIGVIQCSLGGDRRENIAKISHYIYEGAKQGAQVILPPELFAGCYFCREEKEIYFDWAEPLEGNTTIGHFQKLAAELGVALPISFFEREGECYYNSLAMVDSQGRVLGIYRKSHIPDGPGYEEKFYFRPGNTGFKVWNLGWATIGVGICWDQWFPECARAMVLMGAEILLYPTAIGSEPQDPDLDTRAPWQRAMLGHAVSNVVPVAAANRIGEEGGQIFYGCSFIANHRGDKIAEFGDTDTGVLIASFDLALIRRQRAAFGFFRDRRPDLYQILVKE